jgi:hypothetical protein
VFLSKTATGLRCFSKSKIQNLKLLLFPHSRSFASIRGSIYSFQLSAFSFQLLFPHTLPPRPFATFAPWR